MFKRLIALFIIVSFIFSYYQPVYAQDFSVNQLPVPGTMVGESAPFTPLALKGLVINPKKPLEFQFIVDTGHGPQDTVSVKDQANQLVKYFLAGLTIPEGDLWVNLSPYEKNRMVPEALGQTDLGRDLLAQDYILKQLTASLIYPEKDLGKEFWSRVYKQTQEKFGTTNLPVNTFNKVWILPDQAQVFEHGAAAYVTKATLKVMLDEDYLALQKHAVVRNGTDSIGANIVRQIVIPEITKEVNTGKNFAPLRQIYLALILAKWYKETIQNGLLDAVYTNKNKIFGVNLNDPAVKEQIYERYLKAYKKGAFNYIKEDQTPDGQVVPRKYFSGGFTDMGMIITRTNNPAMIGRVGETAVLDIALSPDKAMNGQLVLGAMPINKVRSDSAMRSRGYHRRMNLRYDHKDRREDAGPLFVTGSDDMSKTSYLDRHFIQWEYLRNNILLYLIVRALERDREHPRIVIADVGSSTGEEIARTFYEIINFLEHQGEDPNRWEIEIRGIDSNRGVIEEAKRRIANISGFYRIRKDETETVLDGEKYADSIIQKLMQYHKKFQESVKFIPTDVIKLTTEDLKDADLVLLNNVLRIFTPDRRRRQNIVNKLSNGCPDAVLAIGDYPYLSDSFKLEDLKHVFLPQDIIGDEKISYFFGLPRHLVNDISAYKVSSKAMITGTADEAMIVPGITHKMINQIYAEIQEHHLENAIMSLDDVQPIIEPKDLDTSLIQDIFYKAMPEAISPRMLFQTLGILKNKIRPGSAQDHLTEENLPPDAAMKGSSKTAIQTRLKESGLERQRLMDDLIRREDWHLLAGFMLSAYASGFLKEEDLINLSSRNILSAFVEAFTLDSRLYTSFLGEQEMFSKLVKNKKDFESFLKKPGLYPDDLGFFVALAIRKGIISTSEDFEKYLGYLDNKSYGFMISEPRDLMLMEAAAKGLTDGDVNLDEILKEHDNGVMNTYASIVLEAIRSGFLKNNKDLGRYLDRRQEIRGINSWYADIVTEALSAKVIKREAELDVYLKKMDRPKEIDYPHTRVAYMRVLTTARRLGFKQDIQLQDHFARLIEQRAWSEYANAVINSMEDGFVTTEDEVSNYLAKINKSRSYEAIKARILIQLAAYKKGIFKKVPDITNFLKVFKPKFPGKKIYDERFTGYVEVIFKAVDAGVKIDPSIFDGLHEFCAWDKTRVKTEDGSGDESFEEDTSNQNSFYWDSRLWEMWKRKNRFGDGSYYKILGITAAADEGAVKKAYWAQAREIHPDVAKDKSTAEEKFKQLGEAYEVLGDRNLRQSYNAFLQSVQDAAMKTVVKEVTFAELRKDQSFRIVENSEDIIPNTDFWNPVVLDLMKPEGEAHIYLISVGKKIHLGGMSEGVMPFFHVSIKIDGGDEQAKEIFRNYYFRIANDPKRFADFEYGDIYNNLGEKVDVKKEIKILKEIIAQGEKYAPKIQKSLKGRTVLIVDDDPFWNDIGYQLQRRGANVIRAAKGFEALRIIEEGKKIDLLLSNYMMPDSGGFSLLKNLREMGLSIPVIIWTKDDHPGSWDSLKEINKLFKSNGFNPVLRDLESKRLESVPKKTKLVITDKQIDQNLLINWIKTMMGIQEKIKEKRAADGVINALSEGSGVNLIDWAGRLSRMREIASQKDVSEAWAILDEMAASYVIGDYWKKITDAYWAGRFKRLQQVIKDKNLTEARDIFLESQTRIHSQEFKRKIENAYYEAVGRDSGEGRFSGATRAQYEKILQVKPGAGPAEIRQAYVKLSRLYHPNYTSSDSVLQAERDKMTESELTEKMKEINDAYEELMDHVMDLPENETQPTEHKKQSLTRKSIKGRGDAAMHTNELAENGGIDLNKINVKRTGKTIDVQFDPAQLSALEHSNFKGFTPVITGFRYIQSPFPLLLGINTTNQPERLAKV